MTEPPGPSVPADVVARAVWDAVRAVPGVHDPHPTPLRALGERVRPESRGRVHFDDTAEGRVLELHLVADAGTDLPRVGESAARAAVDCLAALAAAAPARVEVHIDDVAGPDE